MVGVRALALLVATMLGCVLPAQAAGVRAVFDPSTLAAGPFPSDAFTVPDPSQLTGVRVALPKPVCAVRPSDCADIDVLNTLDGFNLQPRATIRFSGGPVNPATLTSATVFFVNLGDTRGGGAVGTRVGINQVIWNPLENAAHVESDALLEQHTRYALVVTRGVRDAAGDSVETGGFARFRHDLNFGQTKSPTLKAYRKALLDALAVIGVPEREIVTMSVFTTQSATAVLEKVRDQIKAVRPAPARILATIPRANLSVIQWTRQVRTSPTPSSPMFVTSFIPVQVYDIVRDSVDRLVFGKFPSPDYETAARFIPPVGSATGAPVAQATNDIFFNLVIPSGPTPLGGWPVAIFGHGFTDSKQGAPVVVASVLAAHGIASIAVNVVGHGGGPLGSLALISTAGTLAAAFPDGGRGIDQDANGTIDSTEGVNAVPPRTIIGSRDGLRQTVIDLMQLVRVIETGGVPGLDGSRIYYAGQSFGGIYGTMFLAVEPSLRAGVPNVPGGAISEIARLSPAFRGLVALALLQRIPVLSNAAPQLFPGFPVAIPSFNENIPLRNQPPLVDVVPGASAIQEFIDNSEWVSQPGNPVAYAPHIRKRPLDGMSVTRPPVIIQFAKGDQTVPNPTATALIRAGDLTDRTTYFRNDLFYPTVAANPAASAQAKASLKNPHTFLTNIQFPQSAPLAIAAQTQIGIFFASNGAVTIDPDGDNPVFETPIAELLLPETLDFIP